MSCPKFYLFKYFSINDDATLSKAFSKSTINRRPSTWYLLVHNNVSYSDLTSSPVYFPFKNILLLAINLVKLFLILQLDEDVILYTVLSKVGLPFLFFLFHSIRYTITPYKNHKSDKK